MTSPLRIAFGFLTFVMVGLIIVALLQLAFITRLQNTNTNGNENENSFKKLPAGQIIVNNQLAILRHGYVKPEILSWAPRIILFQNFLSPEECDYLRSIALPHLKVSNVVDVKTGKGIKSDFRTSNGMFLNKETNDPMVKAIEKRIAIYSQVPVENGELIQVLRYEKNQYYKPHHDYFSDNYNLARAGQRVATMVMYLSDNVDGGETVFPMAGNGESCSCGGLMVEGLCVKPIKGNALLFWSMGLDGNSDPYSLHEACEVISGEKWSATKWMRQKSIY